jgi:predicted lactoylglutathione lyase
MPRQIFINLPVADLDRSVAFYEAMGATRNPQFSDDTAAGMVLSDTIFVMLLTHAKFATFTPRPIGDRTTTHCLLALSCDSRDEVLAQLGKAVEAGGKPDPTPEQDYEGFMYGRSYEDPDGHIWEIFWMNPAAVEAPPTP